FLRGPASVSDAEDNTDEVGMPRVECRQRNREPARERMVTASPYLLDPESMRGEEVAKCLEGHDMDMLERLSGTHVLVVCGEAIPDWAKPRDIRQRKRLVPERQSSEVVPACQVLGADER